MANPTVAELAARVDAGGDKKSGVAMNMAAIAGLRGILALSVARGVPSCGGHLFIYCPGHWRDDGVGYGDMFQFYRTLFFMLLAAMSLSIQYDAVKRHPVRSPRDLFDRASCLTYWFFALRMVVLIAGGWWPLHASPPMQMMTFYAGVLLGQAALHVPLTPGGTDVARLTASFWGSWS
ncbi:hypothetical protein JL721_7663 [Aureococcus anophagefferens]|nr:hypothetical protein JL721_7663 [Aureococcus anophagefferens]